jgi:diguanylate cyclase (GGDEF)-like protein
MKPNFTNVNVNIVMNRLTRLKSSKVVSMIYCFTSLNSYLLFRDEGRKTLLTLTRMAFHDQLTGLPNRRLFEKHVTKALIKSKGNQKAFAVLFLDGDNFKQINDNYGHDIGDKFLIAFANKLKSLTQKGNMVARLGGDEFIILLTDIQTQNDVVLAANKILESFKEPWTVNNKVFYASASIGIAQYPEDAKDIQTLITFADHALYKTKEKGKNVYQFYSS